MRRASLRPRAMVAQRLASSGRGVAMTRCTLIFTPACRAMARATSARSGAAHRRQNDKIDFNRHVSAPEALTKPPGPSPASAEQKRGPSPSPSGF